MKRTTNNRGKKKQKQPINRSFYIILSLLAIAIIFGTLAFAYRYMWSNSDNRILENVTVAGIDIGGMTKDEAISAVRKATENTYTQKPLQVQILEKETALSPSVSHASLDVEAAVERAWQYGHTGSAEQNAKDKLQAETKGISVDIIPYLNLDQDAIRSQLFSVGSTSSQLLKQVEYEISSDSNQLIVIVGKAGYDFTIDKLMKQVLDAYNKNIFQLAATFEWKNPDPANAQAIYDAVCNDPVNSVIDLDTFTATAHTPGHRFNINELSSKLATAQSGQRVTVTYETIEPEITQEKLSALLFRDSLASHVTVVESEQNRDINLQLAAQALNNFILAPGAEFRFNTLVGELTAEKGYLPAAPYPGSLTSDTFGGGVTQISSAIYYCALLSDLDVTVRFAHEYTTSYAPMGMDAYVLYGTHDLCFKNNTGFPIRIEVIVTEGSVTVNFQGTDTKDYILELQPEILQINQAQTKFQDITPENPEGYQDGQVLVTPFNGYRLIVYRCRYDKETGTLISKDSGVLSAYNTRDAIVCKNPASDPATPDTPAPGTPGTGGGVTEDG